jgi:hypothetical protein
MSAVDAGSLPDALDRHWAELVTAALLGTDRRNPPDAPDGPVADVVDDAVRPDAATRMLADVAAVAAVRRAAFVPLPPAPALQAPDADDRPWCPADAVATWRTIVTEWPLLEDEWMLAVIVQGRRLPPDALVESLQRHRSDAVRRARVAIAGGSTAAWLVGHVPDLAPTRATPTSNTMVAADAVSSLPELPVPPELAELLAADTHTFVRRLVPGFEAGAYGAPHRAVLINLVARCRPAVLLDAAAALDHTHIGIALALADLARLRHRMLTELGVAV